MRLVRLIVVALAPFLIAEIVLRTAGYRPEPDPYLVGLESARTVFVRQGSELVVAPEARRTWRARPLPAEPVPDALRIFAVGDSVTWGHQGNELEEPLRAYPERLEAGLRERSPGVAHRVVNLGARTFGTGRVAGVVEEVLRYAPDAVIVYVGTSEHLEAKLREELAWRRESVPAWMQSLRFIDALRALLFERSRVLTLTGLAERDEALRASFVPASAMLASESEREGLVDRATANLVSLADACEAAGVPLLLCTVPSNLRFPPFATRVADAGARAEVEEAIRHAGAEISDGRPAEALERLKTLAARHPEAAGLHYRIAQARDALGDEAGAGIAYRLARDTDACPARALGDYNDAVRRLAASRAGAHLVDIEHLFEGAAADGIPDERLFLDDCHPRPEAHGLIAEEIGRVLRVLLDRSQAPGALRGRARGG